MTTPARASVVIAAYQEEATIARCLSSLLGGAEAPLEVVVVCNGCTDRTAEVAAGFGPTVQVVELARPGKARALNAGDARATVFPRVYLDADVRFERGGVAELVAVLEGGALAAAPQSRVELTGRPWPVRGYYRIWSRRSGVHDSLWGSGAYALSAAGRARFGAFPDVIADDLFVHEQFAAHERRVVDSCQTVVEAPWSTRGLFRRKTRSTAGSMELHARCAETDPRGRLLHHLLDFLPYVAISGAARVAARRQRRGEGSVRWGRDDSRL